MKQGDFTKLAADYVNRPGYSAQVLKMIAGLAAPSPKAAKVADVGAGTGKLTEALVQLGYSGFAIEPNDAMREQGRRIKGGFEWQKGSGEETGLPAGSVDWVLMASSFHWTDPLRSLPEFHRILKPGGYLTVLWNPRDLERSPLQKRIDDGIQARVPGLKRVSSGSAKHTARIEETLVSTGHFKDIVAIEAGHREWMTPQRYMGVWRSVNDIQAQAGEEKWQEILGWIESEIHGLEAIEMFYRTRSWTGQRV